MNGMRSWHALNSSAVPITCWRTYCRFCPAKTINCFGPGFAGLFRVHFNFFILDTFIFEAIMQRQWARAGDALAIHWLWQPLVVFILASHAASMFTFGPQSEALELLTMYAFAAVGTLSRFVMLQVLQVRTNGQRWQGQLWHQLFKWYLAAAPSIIHKQVP